MPLMPCFVTPLQAVKHELSTSGMLDPPPVAARSAPSGRGECFDEEVAASASTHQCLTNTANASSGCGAGDRYLAEKTTMLLLLMRWGEAQPWRDTEAQRAWAALMDTTGMTIVEAEVRHTHMATRLL